MEVVIRKIAPDEFSSVLDRVVLFHMGAFPNGIFVRLGESSVRDYYKTILENRFSNIFGAFHNGELIGFLAGTLDRNSLYKELPYNRLLTRMVRRTFTFRLPLSVLVRALWKRILSKDLPRQVELLAIAVSEKHRQQKVGLKLLSEWKATLRKANIHSFLVHTDNEAGRQFYAATGGTALFTFTLRRIMSTCFQFNIATSDAIPSAPVIDETPFISLIVLCRNEKCYIDKCISSLTANDYPTQKMEIIIVDGMSDDGTRAILSGYASQHPNMRVFDNPGKIAPKAMNIGVKNAKGDFIFILGAHTVYDTHYISRCLHGLLQHNVDCAGGRMELLPSQNTAMAKAIVLAVASHFGSGLAKYKVGRIANSQLVDTVPYGVYRKKVFDRIGAYNEHLVRNLDSEFNLRLRKSGGKILLVPDAVAYYFQRSSLGEIIKYYFINGVWIFYPLRYKIRVFELRHLAPLAFFSALFLLLALTILSIEPWWLVGSIGMVYICAATYSAIIQSRRSQHVLLFPLVLLTYFGIHVSAAAGLLWGGVKFILAKVRGH